MIVCTIPDCGRERRIRGWCGTHYARWWKHGDPLIVQKPQYTRPRAPERCTIDGCGMKHFARGWCQKHWGRWRAHADPLEIKRRPDGSGTRENTGYLRVNLGGGVGPIAVHRLVMQQKLGRPLLRNENVHHRNGCRTDNRMENLELWSTKQPIGQRIEDKLVWAREILQQYDTEEWVGGGC